jgi:four helix bundle protein
MIRDYRELDVFKNAMDGAHRIYDHSKTFPAEERYSLTDQIRRSSRSVCANLAEAWRKRRYPNHFVSKLCDADGEAAETLTWLDFAKAYGFITGDAHAQLVDLYDHIQAQLTRMMDRPEDWCPSLRPQP